MRCAEGGHQLVAYCLDDYSAMGLNALAHDLETLIDDRVRTRIAETLVNARTPGNISKQYPDFADRSHGSRLWLPVKLRKCGTANT